MAIACTLNDDDRGTRAERWRRFGNEARGRVEETDKGLRLTFRWSPEREYELRELADLERECCAFATWTVWTNDGDLLLDVEGEGDAVPVLHGMFKEFPRDA
jgi:hypothetical protein